jgi:hypothetical protein
MGMQTPHTPEPVYYSADMVRALVDETPAVAALRDGARASCS